MSVFDDINGYVSSASDTFNSAATSVETSAASYNNMLNFFGDKTKGTPQVSSSPSNSKFILIGLAVLVIALVLKLKK